MQLRGVTFSNWLQSHKHKNPTERWLRELYPWPVMAKIQCDEAHINSRQLIEYNGAEYIATLQWIRWQPDHGTFKYRVHVESEGLGWHSRALDDTYDMCGTPEGDFVTLFHARKREPLERIARAFFFRRWDDISVSEFKSLAVSRFLAASIVSHVIEKAYAGMGICHYPSATLCGGAPMYAQDRRLWIGYRFYSENAYEWARAVSRYSDQIVSLYFADTKYQYKTDLPSNCVVQSISEIDAIKLSGQFEDLIRAIQRHQDMPQASYGLEELRNIVCGRAESTDICWVDDADVHEALAALKLPCRTRDDLRYQLAAAVVLNTWIDQERRAGFPQRKKFYAFKQRVGELASCHPKTPVFMTAAA